MKNPAKMWLGTLTVFLLALTPSVVPVGVFVSPAQASNPVCSPDSSDYSDGGSTYSILAFKNSDVCDWVVPSGVTAVDVLLVGGGGSAGSLGAGGAGEFLEKTAVPVSGTVAIEVGLGGSPAGSGKTYGENSTFGSLTASGGATGGYGKGDNGDTGFNGASGGGSTNGEGSAGSTQDDGDSDTFGNDGALGYGGYTHPVLGGGGGGAGGPATRATSGAARGGVGKATSLFDSTVASALDVGEVSGAEAFFAGGGGGGCGNSNCPDSSGLSGGLGGGGDGSSEGAPSNGQAYTGGGGGGTSGWTATGGTGGSGVAIVRYPLNPDAPTGTSVTSGDGEMTLSYTAPTRWGGGTLSLEYTTDGGSNWRDLGETDGVTTVSLESDGTALQNNTLYTVKMRAKNDVGSVYTSSEVTVGDVIPSSVGEVLRLDATHPDSFESGDSLWADLAEDYDGTPSNGVSFNSRSKSFDFDGSDDYFDLPDMTIGFSDGLAIHVAADLTVLPTDGSDTTRNFERFIDFGNGSPGANIWFGRSYRSNDIAFETFSGGAGTSSGYCRTKGNTGIIAGVHVYSVVISSTGGCSLYRDGTQLDAYTTTNADYDADPATRAESATTFRPAFATRTNNFVGKSNWSDAYFKGSIQSVVMYNTAQQNPKCKPIESTFTGNGSIGEDGVPYKALVFSTGGACEWPVPTGVTVVDALLIAGGGGGGAHVGGGGGAGGVVSVEQGTVSAGSTINVYVGLGGAGGNLYDGCSVNPAGTSNTGAENSAGTNYCNDPLEHRRARSGQDSSFGAFTDAIGGGGGGAWNYFDPQGGGSGGGSGHSGDSPGTGTSNQGLAGGVAYSTAGLSGGGGGGAGAVGGAAGNLSGGAGGSGTEITIVPTSTSVSSNIGVASGGAIYAAGGGGGGGVHGNPSGPAIGGLGGGGNGNSAEYSTADSGMANTGSGGGATGGANNYVGGQIAGAGGSGVIILRYSTAPGAPSISSVSSGDGSIDVAFTAPSHTGGAAITDYEYSFDGSSWTSLGTASAGTETVSGLTSSTSYSLRLRAVNSDGNGAPSSATTISSALTPAFGAFSGIADGFTVQISNYSSSYSWSASATNGGSASISGSGLVTVSGLEPGETSTVTVSTTRSNYFPGSSSTTGTAALLVDLDATNTSSYPGTGSTWTNLVDGTDYTISNGSFSNVKGGAIDFNGSSTYVDLNTPLTANSNFSFEAWVFDESSTGSRNILSSRDTPLFIGGTTLYGGLGGTYTLVESSGFPQNAWRHVVLTWDDPSNRMRLFVNGVQEDALLTSTRHFTEQSLFVGAHPSGGGASFWDGLIAKARVYNGALSSTQVTARYDATKATYALNAALTPSFGTPTATADGFTVEIANFDANYTWSGSATASGTVSIDSDTGVVTVTGVAASTSSTLTITTARTGYEGGSASVAETSLGAALSPSFGTPSRTVDGFTVQISNYDANYSWSGSATASGSVSISGTGLVTVTGLSASTSSTLTISTTRSGYVSGSGSVTSSSLAPYTIVYSAGNDGTGSNRSSTKIHGTAFSLPDSETANAYFTRAGYGIVGWSENADGSTTDYALGASYTANAGDTLYPVWELNSCVVNSGDTYVNSGGGSGAVFGSSSSMIFKNASSSTSNSYNRAGYLRFEYDPSVTWDGATLQVTVNSSSRGSANSFYNGTNNFQVKVYAVGAADWDESSLTFNSANASTADWGLNTGTFPWAIDNGTLLGTIDIPTSTSTIGVSYGLSNAALDSFLNADSDGEVTFFLVRSDTQSQPNLGFATKDQTTYSAPTLLPHPASCAYTITYSKGSASGAGGSDNTATKIQGTGLTLPDSTTANNYFTRTGYTVAGWATNADGTGTTYAFAATYTAERNQTLYPVWTPDTYTVTYTYNGATGGNSTTSEQYTVDSTVVALPTPAKTGYTFAGWYAESGLTTLVGTGGASYTPAADATLYAKWSAATFTVVYDYNGATGGNTTTDDDFTTGSGSPITLPTPTRTGYTFGGWYSDAALTSSVGAAGASYSPSVNLTVYAKWTADSRSVTYVGTNKTSGSVPTDAGSYIIGNSVVVKANSGGLVRTGYDFAGWTENSDGSGTVLEAGDTVAVQTSDITLYAKWTAATYTITYHANGGSGTLARATDTFTTGNSGVTLPGVGSLTKTGYDFGGWSTTPTGSALVGAYSTSQDRTLYAVWTIKSITYSYAKGSDGDGNSLSSFGFSASFPTGSVDDFGTSVTLSSSVDASIDADANGSVDHQFFGWSDGTTVYDAGDTYVLGETNPTFTAQWIKVFSVRYALAGGSFAGSDSATDSQCIGTDDTCTDGQIISLNSRPSRAGYTFLGWEDQSGTVKSAAAVTTITSSSYLFTAKWDPIDYTLNFNSLGGSNVISDYTQNIGDIVTIPDPGSKTGYSFGGWSDGLTLYGIGGTYTVGASGASFSAQWIPDVYTVTYDWQGGSSSSPDVSDSYTVGTGDMLLTTASGSGYSRDGYTFSGWSTSVGGSAVSGFQPTADDVLYAVWADGNYTLSYDGQGGTVASGIGTVPRTTSVTLPTPVRSNFTFVGWYDAASGGNLLGAGGASFTPTSSQSLYARWVQDSLYGVDLATLETANTYTASNSTSTDTTISHAPSSSSARVQIPAGALPAGTVVTVRYFKDTERATDLISDENTYFFSLLVSWLYGSGTSATVPNTAAGKPITVTLTNSNIKAGAMVYQVIGETVTELARATVDGSVTVELTEDPEVVVAATKPSAPTSVSGTSGDTRVSVSWTAGSSGGSPITGYTVTASPGGATCSTASTSCTINSLTNNTAYTFTVTAQNALGASTASTASSAVTPVGANYAVTFDANGGSSVSAGSFFSGSTVSAPSSPSRSGYTFEGWSTTLDDDTTKVTFPYAPGVTNAITLYALWEVAPAAPTSRGSSEAVTARTVVPPGLSRSPVVLPSRVLGPTQPVAPPRPFSAPIVISPQRGFDPDAGSQARIGGLPATVTKSAPVPGAVNVGVGRVEVGITPQSPSSDGRPVAPVAPSDVSVKSGQAALVAGAGLLPGSSLQVWLPGLDGSTPRELARIPVKSDGTFESELTFSARESETPVPIGRQVLQVTGYDEDGLQTVVDLTINVSQGSPQPELNRAVGALPDLSKGQSLATSAGVPETVTIEVQPEQRSVAVLSGQWELSVEVPEGSGDVGEPESGGSITLVQSTVALVRGDGFQPDTRVDIWLFSDPTLLGSVIVAADGSFTGEVYLDARFAVPGEHTLQLQGVAEDGFIKAANLGVEVQEPVELTTQSATGLLWWVAGSFLLLLLVVLFVIVARRRRSQTRSPATS